MTSNFLKVAYRTLFRNKVFSAINISGLAIGMAAAMLILLWIQHELSYDNFHKNKDRIYEVWNLVAVEGKVSAWSSVSALLARTLEKDLPEVERAVRVTDRNLLLATGDKKIKADGYIVDTGFLQMFSYPMLNGSPSSSLINSHSIVLTEKTAKALFGNEDPLGKIIKIDNSENFTVSGVLKNLPDNTSFRFDYLLPWSFVKYRDGQDLGWNDNSTNTYVMLKPNTEYSAVARNIKNLKQKYHDESKTLKWELFLYPLERWHLYSSFTDGVEDNKGRSSFVNLFGIIATFILLIACINFMNLSTARSEKRAREVGIRKVIGAGKNSLIGQFLVESVLIAFISGVAALVLVQLALPAFNQLTGKQLFLNFTNAYTWMAFVGFVLFTGLLAGSYPAFFLSSFRPIKVLKGILKTPNALITPRKTLVVLQFTFATVLIICTIVIKQQIDHARSRDAGYDKDNLIYHYINGDIAKNYQLIKNELIATEVAKSVTKNNSPLTNRGSDGWGQNWEGKDPNDRTSFNRLLSDEDLGTTAGLEFLQGRDFDLSKFPADSTGLIINESALRIMKFKDPIGKTVSDLGIDWHIVGVIKDFILTSPYEPTRPLLICGAKSSFMSFNVMHIKLNGHQSTYQNLKKAEAIFKKYNPDYPFESRFIDESYARKFENEQRQGTLAALFAALTVFISCLGLFGLALYMAESRTKEIGVRKVLGASITSIALLLSRDFMKLVLVAFVIAAPLAYWGMHNWLQSYEYRVDLQWQVFAIACLLTVTIALITVSSQALKAALTNPAKSLKTE